MEPSSKSAFSTGFIIESDSSSETSSGEICGKNDRGKKGDRRGKKLWGDKNWRKCRQTVVFTMGIKRFNEMEESGIEKCSVIQEKS